MLHYLLKADTDLGGKKNTPVYYPNCQSLCIIPYLTRCHRTTNRIRIYQTALQVLILFEILQVKKTYAEIFKIKHITPYLKDCCCQSSNPLLPSPKQSSPACAAEELMMTGAGATSRTGAPRPFLAPAFTTSAPVWS